MNTSQRTTAALVDNTPTADSLSRRDSLKIVGAALAAPLASAIPVEAAAQVGGTQVVMVTLEINGKSHTVDASPDMPLLWVLRDLLGMNGTKFGCGVALCGACTVNVDGIPMRACVMPVGAAVGHAITTIEGIGATSVGKKVQQAWLDLEVVQCGYCQSGQIMSASALLKRTQKPTDAEIDEAMSGNICRCGTYVRIRAAIKQVASQQGAGR